MKWYYLGLQSIFIIHFAVLLYSKVSLCLKYVKNLFLWQFASLAEVNYIIHGGQF